MNKLTEKTLAAQVALKLATDRTRNRLRDDERGQGSVEYIGIIMVVVAIVGAVVAAATPVGTAIKDQLITAVNSIGSGGGGGEG